MKHVQILEAKIKALEELVEIQGKTIEALKDKPVQIQYVPQHHYYPYYQWYGQYPYWGTYSGYQGGQFNGAINQQIGQQYANQQAQQVQGSYAGLIQAGTQGAMGQGCNNQSSSLDITHTTGYMQVIK